MLAAEARHAAEELSRELRGGELDDRLDELTPRLAEHVRRKLEIARPGYDQDLRDPDDGATLAES